MSKLSRHRVLVSGILSPIAAFLLFALVYTILTSRSADPEKTGSSSCGLDSRDGRTVFGHTHSRPERPPAECALAVRESRSRSRTSLARSRLEARKRRHHPGEQSRNMAMRDVPASAFDTLDLEGKSQRLEDYTGKVVPAEYLGDLVPTLSGGNAKARSTTPPAEGSGIHDIGAVG